MTETAFLIIITAQACYMIAEDCKNEGFKPDEAFAQEFIRLCKIGDEEAYGNKN